MEATPPSEGLGAEMRVLFTLDVHLSTSVEALTTSGSVLSACGMNATYFVSAAATNAPAVRRALCSLVRLGHEVASHGIDHEDYATLPFKAQTQALARSRELLERFTGSEVTAFRAPAYRVNHATVPALERAGYLADTSVTPQRFPLLSSDPSNFAWLLAPRRPYHPSRRSPNRRGDSWLIEVPTSCLLIPFTAVLHQAVTRGVANTYVRALAAEARRSGIPLVFAGHPEDFLSREPSPRKRLRLGDFAPSDFWPTDGSGMTFRHKLYDVDPGRAYVRNAELLRQLMSAPGVTFETVSSYRRHVVA